MRLTDESVVLVPPWLLRTVRLAEASGVTLWMPRGRGHGIRRRHLERIIEQKDLPLEIGHVPGPVVLLLTQPDEEWLTVTPEALVLRDYWRLLFHARVYITVKQRLEEARSPADLPGRIERMGRGTFNDARFVLQRDRLVLPPAEDAEIYARFAALFLELQFFAPQLVRVFFATVDDPRDVLQVLAGDVDFQALLSRTRPAGAAEAISPDDAADGGLPGPILEEIEDPVGTARRAVLLRRAARASSVGNDVRAAILLQQAAGRASAREARGNPHFGRFVQRLVAVLKLAEAGTDWAAALAPVLARAEASWRNTEGRLLYDLQKVCTDGEREVYALDALGWLLTLGHRPLRRALPAQRMVLMCKHLRSARARLGKCHLEAGQRRRLDDLLQGAILRAEGDVRERMRPSIGHALDYGGLRPRHMVERVAREKVIEEFLDTIVRQGFARMGDLRDTLSRNQLKSHDLAGWSAVLWGDQLLQVDRHLRKPLDGVYHAGEAYLRFFQGISSLLFATPLGRVFTYYCLIPFGGAFIVLEVLSRTIGRLVGSLSGIDLSFDPFDRSGSLLLQVLLGSFLLAMINITGVRRMVAQSTASLRRGLRWVFVDWPGWQMFRRFVQGIVETRAWRMLVRYVLKPSIVTLLAWRLAMRGSPPAVAVPILLGIYTAAAIALNSKSFRRVTHLLAHFTVVLWARLITDIAMGLGRVIVRIFRVLLERLERTLYSVDEWFRFRHGQGYLALLAKATLGAVWGVIAYWVRFCVTLLAEPQINPIKHFPVVTVSHKIILPTVPLITSGLRSLGIRSVQAKTYATTIAFLTPGIFGFLAWELKENWKLYSANRAKTLRPVRMGSRGETFAQLLRPGVHSGTVPRIFTRLRHVANGAFAGDASQRKQLRALDPVREAVSRFLQRELAGLLNRHPAWIATPVSVGEVDLAATRIRVTLECPSRGAPARLSFEQHDGWILAGIDEPGWMLNTLHAEATMLALALLGLYQMAGVDLVREQVEALFAPLAVRWMIRGTSLVIWTGLRFGAEVRYSLKEEDSPSASGADAAEPILPAHIVPELLLRRRGLAWSDWSRLWDLAAADRDEDMAKVLEAAFSVLPREWLTGHVARVTGRIAE